LDGGVPPPELDSECLKLDRTLFNSILTNETPGSNETPNILRIATKEE